MIREKHKAGMLSRINKPNKITMKNTYFQEKGLDAVPE